MAANRGTKRAYEFGPFRLDPQERLLLRDGQPVPLIPKAFDLLVALVEGSGHLLEKDELMKRLWPDSFVEEGNLAQNVSLIRKSLGESEDGHQLIETVPKRGYRFVARVKEVDGSADLIVEERSKSHIVIEHQEESGETGGHTDVRPAGTQKVLTPSSWAKLSATRKLGLAAGAFLLAAVALDFYLMTARQPKRPAAFAQFNLTSLTNTGTVYAPTVSPDGKYMAYSSLGVGETGLRVRQLATGSIMQLVSSRPLEHYWAITFSRDGDYVYYVIADAGANSQGALYRVATLGGHPQRLLQHINGGLTMAPDGTRLAFKRIGATPERTALVVADMGGNDEHAIATIDASSDYQSIDWSPDSKTIAYVLRNQSAEGQSWHVAEIPSDGGSERLIVAPRKTEVVQITWIPDHTGLIMNAVDPETHLSQLSYVRYPSGEERRLTNDLNNYKEISITADGRVIVAQKIGSLNQLWIAPGDALNRARLLTSGEFCYHGLAWMPDNQIIFDAKENGILDIWKRSADEGGPSERLTSLQGQNMEPSVTPNGRYVVFISTRSGSRQLWRMDADASSPKQLTSSSASIVEPQCAPDGKGVFYKSYVQGQWKLWRTTLDGSDAAEVIDEPVEYWGISPDSNQLAYSYRDKEAKRTRVAVVPLAGGAPLAHFDFEPEGLLQWTRDGNGLVYVADDGVNIWLQPLAGGPPKQLTSLTPDLHVITFAWSADGKQLAYTRSAGTFDAVALSLK